MHLSSQSLHCKVGEHTVNTRYKCCSVVTTRDNENEKNKIGFFSCWEGFLQLRSQNTGNGRSSGIGSRNLRTLRLQAFPGVPHSPEALTIWKVTLSKRRTKGQVGLWMEGWVSWRLLEVKPWYYGHQEYWKKNWWQADVQLQLQPLAWKPGTALHTSLKVPLSEEN